MVKAEGVAVLVALVLRKETADAALSVVYTERQRETTLVCIRFMNVINIYSERASERGERGGGGDMSRAF